MLVVRRFGRRLERGQRQQVVDDALHAPALLGHEVHVIARALRIELELPHRFQEPYQHGKRGTQFVRDVRDEVPAHGLQARALGNVARKQQPLRVDIGNELHGKNEAIARRFQLQGLGEFFRRDVFDEFRLTHEVGDRLPDVGFGVDAEMGFTGIVAPDDAVFCVQDRDAVGKRPAGLARAGERVRELAAPRHLGALPAIQQREHFLPGTGTLRDGLGERARGPLAEQTEMPNVVGEKTDESQGK